METKIKHKDSSMLVFSQLTVYKSELWTESSNITEEYIVCNRIYIPLDVFSEDKLYIVMELIEGAPLGEHFNSLKEKREKFSEERVWNIFIQVGKVFHFHTTEILLICMLNDSAETFNWNSHGSVCFALSVRSWHTPAFSIS